VNVSCESTVCQLVFDRVPKDSRLDISNVSCIVSTSPSGGGVGALELAVQQRNGRFQTVVELVPFPHLGGFVSNNVISAFATHADTVLVFVLAENPLQGLACHISGQIVSLL
jgi:hypothetical protein